MTDAITITDSAPRGFGAHLQACAVGAGLDNLFKQVVTVALVAAAAAAHPGDPAGKEAAAASYSTWAMLLFCAPFIVLAPLAGSLGDRIPKHRIIRAARLADVPICVLGIWGFATGSPALMLTSIFGLAVASTFFAPVKLAVVPELSTPARLGTANAALAAVTVAAILIGTCLAALTDGEFLAMLAGKIGIVFQPTANTGVLALTVLAIVMCVIGIIGAYRIPALQAQSPATPIAMPWMVVRQVMALNQAPGVWAPALALAGFWALGGAAVVGLPPLAEAVYGLGQAGTVGLFLALVFGIVIGSVLAPRYVSRPFPAGLPVVAALVAGISFAAAGWTALHQTGADPSHRPLLPFLSWLFLCGVGAGMWEVSLTILLQERSPADRRNLIMSGVSVLGSLGTFVAAGCYGAMTHASALTGGYLPNASSSQVFLTLGLATTALGLLCLVIYRQQCAGWLVSLLVKIAYRVRVVGSERFPASGGCLVVCNHLSYSDGVILACHLPRPGRFLVYRRFVEMPVVGFFLRAAGVIPVAAEDRRKALLASIEAAVEAAKQGEVVVIFPEGKLTRSGQMDTFRSGLERIATRAGVPVVPASLAGLWGTVSSRSVKRLWPRPFRAVEMRIGAALSSATTAPEARNHVVALTHEAAQERADLNQHTLASAFLARMRRHPLRIAVRDAGGTMTAWQLGAAARAIQASLGLKREERRVGVLLPPGRAGTIVNLALAQLGRTAVNLNHTAGATQLARMCEIAGITTVVSASLYLRKIGNPTLPGRTVLIEEVLKKVSTLEMLSSALVNVVLPSALTVHAKADDVATIIFSSGSTGDPKGVELTHAQVLANIGAVAEGLDIHGGRDVLLSPLPLFHSFGLLPGMWLGLTLGIPIASHPDPTDGKALGELAAASGATFLMSTPTFVRGYLRRIEPLQLKTLRFAVVGAERCPADLKQQFKERFKADLLEGYGCTELAPVVAINLPTVERDGVTEVRNREGSVGRALPGLHVFTIDPESGAPLPTGKEGLLVVRSPSRMRSYLGRADLTDKAFVHGGYNTGDIGRIDDDGFIHITGRLARFAKIGGEMVPLDNVEAALAQGMITMLGNDIQIELAVTAVADESRGEKLIVLHTGFTGDLDTLLKSLDGCPALWRPKPKDVRQVATIPKLGTGKRDLGALKKLALESVG